MNRLAVSLLAVFATSAFAQQPAATPKPAAASPKPPATSPKPAATATPAKAAPAGSPVFAVARVNPGKDVKTHPVQVDNLGRTSTVLVGDPVINRAEVAEVTAGSEKMKVTSGAKPETRDVPVLRIRFTKDGRKAMTDLSKAAQGQLLAVIIDGKVVAMPKVDGSITGEWTVSGNFTADAAKALAAKVNAAK
jgi:preprotein translocase subunit SecD